jgi:hypothetical protein
MVCLRRGVVFLVSSFVCRVVDSMHYAWMAGTDRADPDYAAIDEGMIGMRALKGVGSTAMC